MPEYLGSTASTMATKARKASGEKSMMGHNGTIKALRGAPGLFPLRGTEWGQHLIANEAFKARLLAPLVGPVPETVAG